MTCNLQLDNPYIMAGMGDKISRAHMLRCIKTIPSGPGLSMQAEALAHNMNMNRLRICICIEWDYGAWNVRLNTSRLL